MEIPNGLILRVKNHEKTIRQVGDRVIDYRWGGEVVFRTIQELKEALLFEKQGGIELFGDIPPDVLTLLEASEEISERTPAPNRKEVVYRDQVSGLLGGGSSTLQFAPLTEAPVGAENGNIWSIEPYPLNQRNVHFMTSAGVYEMSATKKQMPWDPALGLGFDDAILLVVDAPPMASSIDPSQTFRYYRLSATVGTSYTVQTHGSEDMEMDVFDGNRSLIGGGFDDGDVYNALYTFTATTETVYFKVYGYNTPTAVMNFTISAAIFIIHPGEDFAHRVQANFADGPLFPAIFRETGGYYFAEISGLQQFELYRIAGVGEGNIPISTAAFTTANVGVTKISESPDRPGYKVGPYNDMAFKAVATGHVVRLAATPAMTAEQVEVPFRFKFVKAYDLPKTGLGSGVDVNNRIPMNVGDYLDLSFVDYQDEAGLTRSINLRLLRLNGLVVGNSYRVQTHGVADSLYNGTLPSSLHVSNLDDTAIGSGTAIPNTPNYGLTFVATATSVNISVNGTTAQGNVYFSMSAKAVEAPSPYPSIAEDTFDRADNELLGPTSIGSKQWVRDGGSLGVYSNQAKATRDGYTSTSYIDAGYSDFDVSVDIKWGSYAGIAFRYVNDANRLIAMIGTSSVGLFATSDYSTTLLGSHDFVPVSGGTYTLRVVAKGTAIKVIFDGIRVIDTTSDLNLTVKNVGIRTSEITSTFDNFSVKATEEIPAPVQTVIASDDFARANTNDLGVTPVGGIPWYQSSNVFAISNQQVQAKFTGDLWTSLDVGVSDFEFSGDIKWGGSYAGLSFRHASASSYLMVRFNASNLALVTATAALAAHTFAPVAGTTYNIKIIAKGTSIKVYLDGVEVINTTSTINTAATRVALRVSDDRDTLFDNIVVKTVL